MSQDPKRQIEEDVRAIWVRFWADLSDDDLCSLAAVVPNPDVQIIPRITLALLNSCATAILLPLTEAEVLALVGELAKTAVHLLVEEMQRRRARTESVPGGIIRNWIAAGGDSLTLQKLQLLRTAGQRRRRLNPDPDRARETAAMFDAALVEKVGEAAHQHFADTLENQFRRLLTDGFRHAPRQADNAVRDHLRRIYRQRHHETAVGADSLQRLQEHAERDGYRVELVARREEAQILLAEIVVEANLTNREWAVIELRLEELTQATVAKQLRISQPRVAQLERSAMRKLQARVRG